MIKVLKAGLETSIQDYPGRIGYWNQGFPPSGPMDSWSFRMANVLVGNAPGTAGLECQFLGPTLEFGADTVVAVTGADMRPALDGEALPMWRSLAVKAGQTLTEAEVITHCTTHMASFKAPKRVVFADSLPKNPSGKLLKRELRQAHADPAATAR